MSKLLFIIFCRFFDVFVSILKIIKVFLFYFLLQSVVKKGGIMNRVEPIRNKNDLKKGQH